jgi:hypothetical protein
LYTFTKRQAWAIGFTAIAGIVFLCTISYVFGTVDGAKDQAIEEAKAILLEDPLVRVQVEKEDVGYVDVWVEYPNGIRLEYLAAALFQLNADLGVEDLPWKTDEDFLMGHTMYVPEPVAEKIGFVY